MKETKGKEGGTSGKQGATGNYNRAEEELRLHLREKTQLTKKKKDQVKTRLWGND